MHGQIANRHWLLDAAVEITHLSNLAAVQTKKHRYPRIAAIGAAHPALQVAGIAEFNDKSSVAKLFRE